GAVGGAVALRRQQPPQARSRQVPRLGTGGLEPVLIESEQGSSFFDGISMREPVSTSLENAMESLPAGKRCPLAVVAAPLADAAAEACAKPARHGALRRETQQRRHLFQRPLAVLDQPHREVGSFGVENLGKAGAARGEM